MPKKKTAVLGVALAAATTSAATPALADAKLEIPFVRSTLDNGMTVILHEDHTLPLVTVNIAFKVGSRFERQKRTGFAHLFEHLMFMGTKRVPTKMFDSWMEAEGGWNNAWTSEDRTTYYDVAPAHALPLLLWMEADRLSTLGSDMTLEKLNAQRDVVRNERRQTSENEPYGKVELRLPELMYPEGHPYHHPVIGSHEDLEAATVDDVKGFFSDWYTPENASLVIAGDFEPAAVRDTIARYFGGIPKKTPPAAPPAVEPRLGRVVRETIPDAVELSKVVIAWHSPKHFGPGDAELDLLAEVLTNGKASRLYKALVYDKKLAQEVTATQMSGDLSSTFVIEAMARPGVSLDTLEAAIDAELTRLVKDGVTDQELRRAQNQYETAFVLRLQSLHERASMLNGYQTALGNPGYVEEDVGRYRKVTRAALLAQAQSTLDLGSRVILRVVPKEEPQKGAKDPLGGR